MSDPCRKLLTSVISAICRRTREPKIALEQKWMVEVEGRDKGRAIGKNGNTASAIGILLWYAHRAAGTVPCSLQVVGEAASGPSMTPFMQNDHWDQKRLGAMIDTITECAIQQKVAWVIEKTADAQATVEVILPAQLEQEMRDPDFAQALGIVIHSAGASDGAKLKTRIEWR